MKTIALLLLSSICLTACAAAVPTSAPTPVTVPTRPPSIAPTPSAMPPGTAAPTRPAIKVADMQQSVQPDGTVNTKANVTAEGLGLGQIEVSSPEKMFLNETATVSLRLAGAQQIVATTPIAVPAKTPDLPGFVYRFTGNIQLYPVMFAELRALRFDTSPTGPQKRSIDATSTTAVWHWLVSPKAAGRQDLSIELAIPAIVSGSASELSTNVLQNLPIFIQVQTPEPTPAPLTNRLLDSIVNNSGAIIVALIGLIGTLVGILVKLRSDQSKADEAGSKKHRP